MPCCGSETVPTGVVGWTIRRVGQGSCISSRNSANFRERRLRTVEILILPQVFPKISIFQPKNGKNIYRQKEDYPTFSDRPKFSGAEAITCPAILQLRRRCRRPLLLVSSGDGRTPLLSSPPIPECANVSAYARHRRWTCLPLLLLLEAMSPSLQRAVTA